MASSFDLPFDFAPYRLSGTVYGVLLNHRAALEALGAAAHELPYKAPPKAPVLYLKPRNTLVPPGAPLCIDDPAGDHDWGISADKVVDAMTIQEIGGTRRTVEAGIAAIRAMLPVVDAWKRQEVPVSELVLAMECGGSDGYSGITANPALGAAVDTLVRHGGTAILSETPEVYGAEHLLTRRAVSREVGEKLIARIRWWEDYTEREKGEMNNNPSPGNKAGGLTTILENNILTVYT